MSGFKDINVQVQIPKVIGQRSSSICLFGSIYCLCGVQSIGPEGVVQNSNKPSLVLVHMELAVTLGRLRTIKSLCKVYDSPLHTVFWEVREVKSWETKDRRT